jgi:hypothetical protein
MNLIRQYVIYSVFYIDVSSAVPGDVEDLSLNPSSHNISVNWKKPIVNSYCVFLEAEKIFRYTHLGNVE